MTSFDSICHAFDALLGAPQPYLGGSVRHFDAIRVSFLNFLYVESNLHCNATQHTLTALQM
jgi:hypothetical protein